MRLAHMIFLISLVVLGCDSDTPIVPQPPPDPQMLIAHNKWRFLVGVTDMEWSEDLAKNALALLDGNTCNIIDNPDGFGQNNVVGLESQTMEEITDLWAMRLQFYDYVSDSCTHQSGNCDSYKQIVWANSTTLGCAKVTCFNINGFAMWVCLYDPPGNIPGEKPY